MAAVAAEALSMYVLGKPAAAVLTLQCATPPSVCPSLKSWGAAQPTRCQLVWRDRKRAKLAGGASVFLIGDKP